MHFKTRSGHRNPRYSRLSEAQYREELALDDRREAAENAHIRARLAAPLMFETANVVMNALDSHDPRTLDALLGAEEHTALFRAAIQAQKLGFQHIDLEPDAAERAAERLWPLQLHEEQMALLTQRVEAL